MPNAYSTHITARVPSTQSILTDGQERTFSLSFGNELTALVGRNGVGKTRFIRTLLGFESLPGIEATTHGSIGYLPQETLRSDDPNLSDIFGLVETLEIVMRIEAGNATLDEMEQCQAAWTEIANAEACLSKLGIANQPWHRALRSFSGGEQTRIELARLVHNSSSFLILDEPTNHLDVQARKYVYDLLSQRKGGTLIVTHDRKILSSASRLVEMSDLGFQVFSGNYSDFQAQKNQERGLAEKRLEDANQKLKAIRLEQQKSKEKAQRRDSKGVAKRRQGGHSKSQFDFKKSQAEKTKSKDKVKFERKTEQAWQQQTLAAKAVERGRSLYFEPPEVKLRRKQQVLRLDRVSFAYSTNGNNLFEDVDFEIVGPERVALVGPNGCGKTTLLHLIGGTLLPTKGRIEHSIERCALLDQHTAMLDLNLTVRENFQRANPQASANKCHAVLASFLFRGADSEKPVTWLSGGERMRAALACLLGADDPPQLLLLDEPTNHLDLEGLEAVTLALRQFGGAMVVTSHDETFLEDLGLTQALDLAKPNQA